MGRFLDRFTIPWLAMFIHVRFYLALSVAIGLPVLFSPTSRAVSTDLDSPVPHWIWIADATKPSKEGTPDTPTFVFQRSFDIKLPVRTATIRLAADFCHATVVVNERRLFSVEPYCQTIDADITDAMVIGKNVFRIEVTAKAGPSAIASSLSIGIANDPRIQTIVTDGAWSFTTLSQNTVGESKKMPVTSLGTVKPELWGIGRRSSKVEPTENYEQWRQAVAGKAMDENRFWTVPGFEIALVRSATSEEGSWVSMAFDPKGRLTIAREEKGLLRMTLGNGFSSIEKVEVINDQLLECRGLLYAHNSLYANANNSKGLYRLSDKDEDDTLEDVQLLREFPGGVGHGRNDLAIGRDGWIYSIHGDSVEVPTDNVVDRTSPFRDTLWAGRVGQGHVVRMDPEGKQWEVLCSGLRNPFGLAVNPEGDWFTYDADAEFDMGAPWYRPTRVVQLLSGADYGWRSVTGKWPPYFPDHPDNAMPTLDIGKGSPTSVLFATDAKFPEAYRRSLLILDWTYGRILAVHLAPRGAGYRANAETFLQGRPLNVTDLAIGPDGALYIVTGGRKTQSALYRIAYVGGEEPASSPSLHEQHCELHAQQAKQIRSQLENMHGAGSPTDLKLAWLQLDSLDWNIRNAARVAIEHQPIGSWREQALSEPRTTAAIEACLALVRSGDPSAVLPILDRLLEFKPANLSLSQAWGILQCYSLLEQSSTDKLKVRKLKIIEQVESLVSHSVSNANDRGQCGSSFNFVGACASLLASFDVGTTVLFTSTTLLRSPVQEHRLHALLALRNVDSGWTIETRKRYFQSLNEGSSFVRGEGMEKFLKQIRSDAAAKLTEDERKVLADLLEPTSDSTEVLPMVIPRQAVKQWSMNDLVRRLSADPYKPDHQRGAVVFVEAMCSRCHRSGARGLAVGPDLTQVANRFSRKDILQSILEPSHVVAENYRKVQVATKDGRVLVGRLRIEGDYRSQKLQIATDSLNASETIEIDKSEIESIQESAVSPMPSGLVDGFQADEILDLLEYLSVGAS